MIDLVFGWAMAMGAGDGGEMPITVELRGLTPGMQSAVMSVVTNIYNPSNFESVVAHAKSNSLCEAAGGFFIVEKAERYSWVAFGVREEATPSFFLKGYGGQVVGRYVWHNAGWIREDISASEPQGGITWP